ncbi:hypothetical protein LOC68_23845 [Blastopirellula sp. JC732]|uniref:Uncharacterized protein n=1 Tax=Blastopirellula sediminis TaxID=2894196 RepID=A0A9X1SM94_9BACT|nr:hypothetical protein [Blastopirellula sediminis]MCC9605261.1 hypothetical protein [Blastopirellula sediminis]MCC9631439.1 hypothetical protein [Blastopirellula sediminis]
MTTANAIEAMTDAGEFEILATRVLRHIDADYARVEHLGVNADGKTVKNPIDGFTKVPSTKPSRFVMAAFSTDQTDNIEKKLLFDHTLSSGKSYKPSDDGDLIKASRRGRSIRHAEPDAELVFTFCTNKQPNDAIMQRAYEVGRQLGIEVRFLARSTIRDHLDTTPQGQWLRKAHLGISADMLSLPLLKELASQTVSAYLHELFCSENAIVETATTRRLLTLSSCDQPNVQVLTGPSGSGKSVACYRLLFEVEASGGIGLWLPAENVATSMSLEEAITKTLQTFCPNLSLNAGRLVRELVTAHKAPLVIVVDDVNRTSTPSQCIRKLISWNRREDAAGTPSQSAQIVHDQPHLVIPVWNHFWNSIASRYRDDRCVGELSTRPMTRDEAYDCLQACSQQTIGQLAAFDLARKLEYDPILIGLWGRMYGRAPFDHLEIDPHSLMEDYIRETVEESSVDGSLLPADIHSAIALLASKMLTERELYPRWSRVAEWLSESQLAAIRRLCVGGGICSVVTRDSEPRFVFRHDRLLEAVLVKPLGACLRNIESNRDLIADPFFTDSLARTLVSIGDAEVVRALVNHAPLAILRSIRHLTDSHVALARAIVDCGASWLGAAASGNTTPPAMVSAAADILRSTKDPMVLAVTDQVKGDCRFSGARLVNGDSANGKFFVFSSHFYPGSRAPFIEEAIHDAKRLHFSSLRDQLVRELESSPHSEKDLCAALVLAGYLGDEALAKPVLHAWMNNAEANCLVEALWASLRCSVVPELTLVPVLNSWASLSDEESPGGLTQRNAFVSELSWSLRHGVNDSVVACLVDYAKTDGRLSDCLMVLLVELDNPIAVGHVAREVARIDRETEGTSFFSFGVYESRDRWDPLSRSGKRLSDESRAVIFSMWEKADNESEKNSLLRTWVRTTDSVGELLELPRDVQSSTTVLSRRVRLGDPSCVDSLIGLLKNKPSWWNLVPHIWTNQFVDVLDKELGELGANTPDDYSGGRSDKHYHLTSVLRKISVEIAERLLLTHWDKLKYSPLVFQTALYVGGDALLSACEHVLANAPGDWKPFEYIWKTFGFKTTGLRDRLTFKHIEALLPFISHIPDMALVEVAEWLMGHEREDVFQECVRDEIESRVEAQRNEGGNSYIVRSRRVSFPTDRDLLESLDGAENDSRLVWRWCRSATDRGDSPERLRGVFQAWFFEDPTPERLVAIARIVMEVGVRSDVVELQENQIRYGNESTTVIVEEAAFIVRYRTLS